MLLKITLFAIMLSLSCKVSEHPNENTVMKKVTIIGKALDDKGDAVVITDKPRKKYFLEGLDEWDEKYYGKKVKVTGELVIEIHENHSTDSVWVQEYVGKMLIIKKPKWELVK